MPAKIKIKDLRVKIQISQYDLNFSAISDRKLLLNDVIKKRAKNPNFQTHLNFYLILLIQKQQKV